MKHLQALLALIIAALTRGGTGAARREAQQEILRMARQGMRMAQEMIHANMADFARHFEEWFGFPPAPATPREDPQHAAMARKGHIAVWFLLGLKAVFWTVFGPTFFNVLPWLAVVIALCVSIPMSIGLKPLIARLILKPGLTRQEQERRLHHHVVAGMIAFAIVFGGLFLLRGLVGALALIGALLVLPILSLCDMVLLYLMGVAEAHAALYSWAAAFVAKHHALTNYLGQFEHHAQAARQRLGMPEDEDDEDGGSGATAEIAPPLIDGPTGTAVTPLPGPRNIGTAAALTLGIVLFGIPAARAQYTPPAPISIVDVDSTASIFPSVASTLGPTVAQAVTTWSEQNDSHILRVATFERDGWLPRTIMQTTRNIPIACTPTGGEHAIFKGINDAIEEQARNECNHAREQEANKVTAQLTKALATAWHAQPLVDPKQGRSCTAFQDMLASAARIPPGNLVVILTDTEETCKKDNSTVPDHSMGANVVIILVPSKADMGPGVSAANKFDAKKANLEKVAPWIRAILAPTDVEMYRLPTTTPPPHAPHATTVGFWQR
jgi:hypothetical protein